MKNTEREAFLAKLEYVPSIINEWSSAFGGLTEKVVLDFGCGEGLQAAGIAKNFNPKLVFGVDINNEHASIDGIFRVNSEPVEFEMPLFQQVAPGQKLPFGELDLIYSWSVFEHINIEIVDLVISDLRSALAKNGHLLIQIAPLYYSKEGSHLWEIGYRNWEHLTNQLDRIWSDLYSGRISKDLADGLWSMFSSLNKLTSSDLVARVETAGFKVIRKYETQTVDLPPAALLNVYREDVLRVDQIVLLFQKT